MSTLACIPGLVVMDTLAMVNGNPVSIMFHIKSKSNRFAYN